MCFSNSHPDTPPLAMIKGSRKRKQEDLHEISSDENDNEPPTIQSLHQKRVKFGNLHQTTTMCPSTILHKDLDKQALWWRRQERIEIQQNCRETYQRFRKDHMKSVQLYLQVVRQCQTTTDNESTKDDTEEYLKDITLIVPDCIRGLEWGVLPSSSKQCRSQHAEHVLECQAEAFELQPQQQPCDTSLLALQSICSSRPSRVLARLLGEGDAVKIQAQQRRQAQPCSPNNKSLVKPTITRKHSSTTTAHPRSSRPRMWCR
jgi:hypothetical protein